MERGVLMHNEMMKMFKKSVPRSKKLYQSYMQECKVPNFSYNSFKKENIILIELKDYLMSLDEYYYLSQNQIDNIFNYLKQNISLDNFNKMKKVYKNLNDLSEYLSIRYNSKNSLNGDNSRENCLYLLNKIEALKSDIASKKGYNIIELEKIFSFENTIKKILNPKEYVFDENKFLYLVNNLPFLLNSDRNNRDFNDNFCRFLERAKINRDREKLSYYKNMYNYLSTLKLLKLDTDYINSLLDINIQSVDQTIIDKKIRSMRIDSVSGLRQVEDYIVSIDTDITKKIDDAFSIEKIGSNYLLGIHIASVYSLHYFEEDSMEVNQKANVKKANASLSKNKKRTAMSMYVLIDNNGMVRNCKVLNTVLKANANLVYEDVPHLLRNEDVNPELKTTIVNLLSVYNLIENSKFPKNPTISNFAYLITSKLMILCSCLYSEKFKQFDIPAIYLCGNSKDNYYSIESGEYYTGFTDYNSYTRITSPIYDTSSLINQLLVNRYLLQQRSMNEEEIDEMTLKLKPIVNKLNKNKDTENMN